MYVLRTVLDNQYLVPVQCPVSKDVVLSSCRTARRSRSATSHVPLPFAQRVPVRPTLNPQPSCQTEEAVAEKEIPH